MTSFKERVTFLCLLLTLPTLYLHGQNTQLAISKEMIHNLAAHGDATILFNNQPNTNNTCPISYGDENAYFHAEQWNNKNFIFPIDIVVDFESQQNINEVCFDYIPSQETDVKIYVGSLDQWTYITSLNGNDMEDCSSTNLDVNTKQIKFSIGNASTKIKEISIFGNTMNQPICPPQFMPPCGEYDCDCNRPKVTDIIGVNTSYDAPFGLAHIFSNIRNYQASYFNIGFDQPNYPGFPNGQYNFWPFGEHSYLNNDFFYSSMKDAGVKITSTTHHAPAYMVTFGYESGSVTPYAWGSDYVNLHTLLERQPFIETDANMITLGATFEEPHLYKEFSEWFYQLGSRYGSPGNLDFLKVEHQALHGLGTIQYIENWNEPDKWWHRGFVENYNFLDPDIEEGLGYFSPFEYAAMSSANFDGHGGTLTHLNSGIGLKAANSNTKFVMAGLAELNLEYVKTMKYWFDNYRAGMDKVFPFDVINFHSYANTSPDNLYEGYAISPEQFELRDKMKLVVDYRNQYLPGVEVWLSEFGYDTNPGSPQCPKCENFENPSTCEIFEVQAQWLVRSYLELAAAGVDKAMAFNIRDEQGAGSGGLFQTCGLATDKNSNFQPKKSWYYVSTLSNIMEGLQFDPSYQHTGTERVYRFVDDCTNPQKIVYAAWSSLSKWGDDTSESNLTIPIDPSFGNFNNATLITMENGDIDGVQTTIASIAPNSFNIPISERPKFLVLGATNLDQVGCQCNPINYSIQESNFQKDKINDEQYTIGSPYCNNGAQMWSAWTTQMNEDILLDFGSMHELSAAFIYQQNNSNATLKIAYATEAQYQSGVWIQETEWEGIFAQLNPWKSIFYDESFVARYVKITVTGGSTALGEVAFCGFPVTNQSNHCNNGVQDEDETGIDCGGQHCVPCGSCFDGIQNQNETAIDCGGVCPPCATCFDGIQNQDETAIDCGGTICVSCENCNDGIQNQGEVGIDCGGPCPPCQVGDCQIALNANMLFNSIGQAIQNGDSGSKLVDEQSSMGDPINGAGNDCYTAWEYPWVPNQEIYIDLGAVYNISSIHLFDGNGSGQFKIKAGLPNSGGQDLLTTNLSDWMVWSDFPINNVSTRYLTLVRVDPRGKVNEIAICGTQGTSPGSCQIDLSTDMVYNADHTPSRTSQFGGSLVDEQNAMGDPINHSGLDVHLAWEYGEQVCYIDLQEPYVIESIHLYDGYGNGWFEVAAGLPSEYNPYFIGDNMNAWPPEWKNYEQLQVTAQYLTFKKFSNDTKVNEVAICGYPVSENRTGRQSDRQQTMGTSRIYPNPAKTTFVVESVDANVRSIKIQDLNGRILSVKTDTEGKLRNRLNIEHLANGIYFISVEFKGHAPAIHKLIKG